MAGLSPINRLTTNAAAQPPARERLGDAADQVVGATFYGTLLRSMRNSTLRGEYGHGGRGEEIFQAQLDQVFAADAGRARSSSLTEAVVRLYERQQEALDRRRADDGGES